MNLFSIAICHSFAFIDAQTLLPQPHVKAAQSQFIHT